MESNTTCERFALTCRPMLPWWLPFAIVAVLLTNVALRDVIHGEAPPNGWFDAALSTPVILAVFFFLWWLGNVLGQQHAVVRADGVLLAVPFRRVIPFRDIQIVRPLTFSRPIGQYWLSTFVKRKLIPAWDEPPNIEILFSRPIRLNLYPPNWFTNLQLTVDRPDEFLSRMRHSVSVDATDAHRMYRRTRRHSMTRLQVAGLVALGVGLFVLSLAY